LVPCFALLGWAASEFFREFGFDFEIARVLPMLYLMLPRVLPMLYLMLYLCPGKKLSPEAGCLGAGVNYANVTSTHFARRSPNAKWDMFKSGHCSLHLHFNWNDRFRSSFGVITQL
jgi:hypothetical protein